MIKIALADDHNLFRSGIGDLLNKTKDFSVILQAESGEELLEMLKKSELPDIAIIDIKMKKLSGFETVKQISQLYPSVKCLALSMYNDEHSIIKMLKSGAKGYLLKNAEPWELTQAVNSTAKFGIYNGDAMSKALMFQLDNTNRFELKDVEIEFLKLACSEYTYKEIAAELKVSHRTVDGYRDRLFEKLDVSSRVGLVLFAIRQGYFKIE